MPIIRQQLDIEEQGEAYSQIAVDRNVNDGAVRVYGMLTPLCSGSFYSDKELCENLDISQQVLTSRKKQLKDAGYLLADNIQSRIIVMYIGNNNMSASEVKKEWED